jgi:amino acid permease
MLDALEVPAERQTSTNLNVLTLVLLTLITLIATFVTDLGTINAVGGGTLATFMCFVFPALMYRKAIMNLFQASIWQRREVVLVMVLMVIGVVLGAVGVIESLRG